MGVVHGEKRNKAFWALIQAAQAVCQSRGGSNPQATAKQHEIDLDKLTQALGPAVKAEWAARPRARRKKS